MTQCRHHVTEPCGVCQLERAEDMNSDMETARRLLENQPWHDRALIEPIAAALRTARSEALEPIPKRYACQRCGRRDGLDAVVPDDVWEKLSAAADEANLLCLWCMDALADRLGLECSTTLHFAGTALHGTSNSDADRDFIGRLVRQRDEALEEAVRLRRLVEASRPLFDEARHLVNDCWHSVPGYERHPRELGVTIKTNCGVMYDIADALAALDGTKEMG